MKAGKVHKIKFENKTNLGRNYKIYNKNFKRQHQ